jgi:predicted nucleic acid-binding protein
VIFVDTSFLFALVSTRDEHHTRVLEVLRGQEGRRLPDLLLTTNHIVSETLTLMRGLGHDTAVRMGERLYGEKIARLHWATRDDEMEAFDYFRRHQDKRYSVVDCLSFVVMQKYGIDTAWAVDGDFTHRFVAVPGPLPR